MKVKRQFSQDEIFEFRNKLLKTKRPEENIFLLDFLLNTGMRISEISNLKVENVNFQNYNIQFLGKGDKIRHLRISKKFTLNISIYVNHRKMFPNDLIFPKSTRNYQFIFENVGIPAPHGFRHHYAITILQKTKNIKYLQSQLGHASINTTAKFYLSFMDFDQENEKLEEL